MIQRSRGFTLIELLVVVSIIVLLLSLLAPAMDRAIYMAELTQCGAQMKGVGSGVLTYAAEQDRAYPFRPAMQPGYERRPMKLQEGNGPDDRPILLPYVQMDALVDPLCEPIDLDPNVTMPDSHIYSNYDLWFGFSYDNGGGAKRLGSKVRYQQTTVDLLMSDTLAIASAGNYIQSAHADANGVLYVGRLQDQLAGTARWTYSLWNSGFVGGLGTMERNFLRTDGSVERMDKLKVTTDGGLVEWEERLNRVPGRGAGEDQQLLGLFVPR